MAKKGNESFRKTFEVHLKYEERSKNICFNSSRQSSTGKSTLLNTMFDVQFPVPVVSVGQCTKGAFMQLIPIVLENFTYDGLLITDIDGFCVREYRQDKTHDNKIATFALGISDLAIINVRGERPTNMEDFLQVSTYALMRMSMADLHPSVVFVHQNCDPSSKEKNLTRRHTFMKEMDEAVSAKARLIQMQDQFSCFQDVVEISLQDEKNDFVYFPPFLQDEKNDFVYFPPMHEGSPPMSPPSGDYSKSCSNLTRYILSKMKANFEKYNNAQTLQEFAEKITVVWKGILEENFVLSFSNNARNEVQYDTDNQMNNWRAKMESYMEDILEKFCGEIEADFKAKDVTPGLLRTKIEQLEAESRAASTEQEKKFISHIDKQT